MLPPAPKLSAPLDYDRTDLLAATYSSKISYFDVLNVEARHHVEIPLCAGSSESPHLVQWVMVADWHDLAYEELLSTRNSCLHDLVSVEARVNGLLSQSPESADKYEPLKIFLQEYLKFLSLSKADFSVLSKNKCFILMNLIKSFVAHFEDYLSSYEYGKHLMSISDLSQVPELQQRMVIKVLSTNPSGRSESAFSDSACQSEWVRLEDWHDLAHRELKCIRHVYLPQLLKAYERVCGLWLESQDASSNIVAVKIFLLEFCKFLTLSRAELVGVSRGECYVFMMLIKNQLWQQLLPTGSQLQIPEIQDELDIRVQFLDSSSGLDTASSDRVEWDLQAHQKLQSLRNIYSSHLDKVYNRVYELWSQPQIPFAKQEYELTLNAVGRAINFLAISRACIRNLSEEIFNDNIEKFKVLLEHPRISNMMDLGQPVNNQGNPSLGCEASADSAQLIQSETLTNLTDQFYEELQLMKKEYVPLLLKAYNKVILVMGPGSKGPEKDSLCRCLKILDFPRSSWAFIPVGQLESWKKDVENVVSWSKRFAIRPDRCSTTSEQPSFGYREVKRNLYEMD